MSVFCGLPGLREVRKRVVELGLSLEDAWRELRPEVEGALAGALAKAEAVWDASPFSYRGARSPVDWPLRHFATSPTDLHRLTLFDLQSQVQSALDQGLLPQDLEPLATLAKTKQHQIERIVLWDAWFRAHEGLGRISPARVEMYNPEIGFTEYELLVDLVQQFGATGYAIAGRQSSCEELHRYQAYIEQHVAGNY